MIRDEERAVALLVEALRALIKEDINMSDGGSVELKSTWEVSQDGRIQVKLAIGGWVRQKNLTEQIARKYYGLLANRFKRRPVLRAKLENLLPRMRIHISYVSRTDVVAKRLQRYDHQPSIN